MFVVLQSKMLSGATTVPNQPVTDPEATPVSIEPMAAAHWPSVRAIYEEGMATSNATFETSVPAWQEWDAHHLKVGRLVACHDSKVLGWAALSPVSARAVYRGVAEVSVYVKASARGQKVGSALLSELVRSSELAGIWTLQAGIFQQNLASLALHQANGFRSVGVRERIGCLNGCWHDVVLMERRSTIVGIEPQ
jgi:L-amino acid N-acyltransferase YncA